jgi:hypothetical protein
MYRHEQQDSQLRVQGEGKADKLTTPIPAVKSSFFSPELRLTSSPEPDSMISCHFRLSEGA